MSDELTKRARALIAEAEKQVVPVIRDVTYPLFAFDATDRPDFYASSILLGIEGHTLLITAAHAVSEIKRAGSNVHVGMHDRFLSLPEFAMTSEDGNDPLDIAALLLPDDLVQEFRTPWPIQYTTTDTQISDPSLRLIYGYPLSKNKPKCGLNEASKVYTVVGFPYFGASKGLATEFIRHRKSREYNVALKYQKRSKRNDVGIVQPPHPRGMSGGGFWCIPNLRTLDSFFLEGISVRYCKNGGVVFATRMEQVLNFLRVHVLPEPNGPSSLTVQT